MAKVNDAALLRLSAELLNRINADPQFSRKFDKDPAGALQDAFPQLARVPKKKISSVLDMQLKEMEKLIRPGMAHAELVGLLSRLARAATRVIRTSRIQSAAKLIITVVASEIISCFLGAEAAEPIPE